MFKKILIANRGEIACRIIKTARAMNIATVAVHSEADRGALHVEMADEALAIGPAAAAQSYLSIDAIIAAVGRSGAQAVHPGYGFLSENSACAEALAGAGVAFIGPPPGAIAAMGDKIAAKALANRAGVSTVPGHPDVIADADEAVRISRRIGYPVMIKASAGGGGKGMRIALDDDEARAGFVASANEARASFGDERIFIEKFIASPRHIEIQLLADQHGNCVYLHERECSIQRRNQKVIEEAPSPFIDAATRRAMGEQAVALARAVNYASAGTVEFIVDGAGNFYFLEMNTRLQVEHAVTELITGIDLVEQMIRVAAGEPLPFTQADLTIDGWAIESRVYAEDPYRHFLPSTGRLTRYRPPAEVSAGPLVASGRWVGGHTGTVPPQGATALRNDTGVGEGGEISRFYDPMIAKLCTWAPTRGAAIAAMGDALDAFQIEGIGHNLPFLSAVMDHPRFVAGDLSTAFIDEAFPEGFTGATLSGDMVGRVIAAAGFLHHISEAQRGQISGRLDRQPRSPAEHWVVAIDTTDHPIHITADADGQGATVTLDGTALRVTSTWRPGQPLARLVVEGAPLVMKVDAIPEGFRLRLRGACMNALIRSPRAAELARLMPIKAAPDTSRLVTCPMPGLVVALSVAVGDAVEMGQPLATIEAMKMENVLRAPRDGVIASVNVTEGAILRADDVVMVFE